MEKYRFPKRYHNYRRARDAAWKVLIEEEVCTLPVPIVQICNKRGIDVKIYDGDGEDGSVQFIAGKPVILISKRIRNRARRRFTVAHELGHIVLKHNEKYALVKAESKHPDSDIERTANEFAVRLLAPACVLWGCNARTPEQIKELCNISMTAAKYRAERMEELCSRGKFLTSEKEKQVYEQFLPFIDEHMY